MRTTFETHIRCADCGKELELVYEKDAKKEKQKTTGPGQITGACKVENSIFVLPCKDCMRPLERVKAAMKILKDI